MARPKSDDERPESERAARGSDEHPGVYVQVVGTPRRRRSSAGHGRVDSSSSERPVSASTRAESSSSERPIEGLGGTASTYQVEHAREEVAVPSRQPSSRKGPGPLGMHEGPQSDEASARVSETRTRQAPAYEVEVQPIRVSERVRAPGSVQRVQVVEINAPALDLSNTNHRADIVSTPASTAPVSTPPAPEARSVPPEPAPEAPASAGTRDIDPLVGASVLDAPPSMHVSERPKQQGPSWGMLVMVAVLSSIIAAAGMLAFQDWRTKHAAQSAPAPAQTTARASTESAPAALPTPAASALPSDTLAPAPANAALPTPATANMAPALPKHVAQPVAAQPVTAQPVTTQPTTRAAVLPPSAPAATAAAAAAKVAKPQTTEAPTQAAAPASAEIPAAAAAPAERAASSAKPAQDEATADEIPVNPY